MPKLSDKLHPRAVTACALILMGVGAWLRLHGLHAMEFKGDEQLALTLGIHLLDDRQWASPATWPTRGMLSSNNVANAPLFTWIVALAWRVTRHPVGVAAFVAIVNVLCLYPLWRWARRHTDDYRALLVLALCATSPFAVLFSRKIWTQDLLLPGVVAVLWSVEWLRSGRVWRGCILLLTATILAGQLHQSGPIALALLPTAFAAQAWRDRRQRGAPLTFARPSLGELAALAAVVLLNLAFWIPYLRYLMTVRLDTLANRPRLATPWPGLLVNISNQIMPRDLFFFFAPDRAEFMSSVTRAGFYYAALGLGAPLLAYGLWRWLRASTSVPVIGLWWIAIVAAFTLARIPTYPFYVLILAPLPAMLAAGAFDSRRLPPGVESLLAGWRLAYVIAMCGLTIALQSWVIARGGSLGDYGLSYAVYEAQARTIVGQLPFQAPEHFYDQGELAEEPTAFKLHCHPPAGQVLWLLDLYHRRHPTVPDAFDICDTWVNVDGRLAYRWMLRR